MLIQATDITYLIANDCVMRTTVYHHLMSISELVPAHNGITEIRLPLSRFCNYRRTGDAPAPSG